MTHDRIAVVDVETTGLSPWRHDRIVEIAVVVISPDGTVLTEYETLVNPGRDIGPSSIHQISASDVVRAPSFAAVAGDVLEILSGACAVAGHNVSFDSSFLIKEYERLGVVIPDIPLLCTCELFGRSNLAACCRELGICFDGVPHRAIADARATARIVSYLCCDDPVVLEKCRLVDVQWPAVPASKTPCFRREHAQEAREEPPGFLQRIVRQMRHDVEAETPQVLAYMALIDRVLEDRMIDEGEEATLVEAALKWQLSQSQLTAAHVAYLHSLAVTALADGVISQSERRDLHVAARLLGQAPAALDAIVEAAAAQLAAMQCAAVSPQRENPLRGQRVCFTGELQATIGGQPVTRDIAEKLACDAGLVVVGSVTKKLDVLVVADPCTQSTKARKARDYGIRILSDAVFWKMAGIAVD